MRVCAVADCDEVSVVLALALDVVRVVVAVLVAVLAELAATVRVVVDVSPSCQASTPPNESIDATLRAVTAFRARAACGTRLGRRARTWITRFAVTGGSSMTTTVRRRGERATRAG